MLCMVVMSRSKIVEKLMMAILRVNFSVKAIVKSTIYQARVLLFALIALIRMSRSFLSR